jgi:hypothetical protein
MCPCVYAGLCQISWRFTYLCWNLTRDKTFEKVVWKISCWRAWLGKDSQGSRFEPCRVHASASTTYVYTTPKNPTELGHFLRSEACFSVLS